MKENIKEKIQNRLDLLEQNLKAGNYLQSKKDNDLLAVDQLIESISKFWRILTDEEKDFVQAARIAIKEQRPWK